MCTRRQVRVFVLVSILGAPGAPIWAQAAESDPERDKSLRSMEEQITRLRGEMEALRGRERGVLNEIDRLGATLRLHEAELAEASARLEATRLAVLDRTERLQRLEDEQRARRRYLTFRLRELYKRGAEISLERLLGGDGAEAYLRALRYAAYLSERDGRLLRDYREDAARLRAEKTTLLGERDRLESVTREAERTAAAVARSRSEKASYLAGLRRDRGKHQEALRELESATRDLGGFVGRLEGTSAPAGPDVRRFRGLLDWPAQGRISAGFGRVVHPRFRTAVPHPGLDIEAREGTDFRAVFDGKVAFSSWLRGYGLTVIVEHGRGVISIYAHASVLLVESGEDIGRGQPLGKVGDTGSLRGPYLYFEMRQDGKPVDPMTWLRRR